MKKEEFEQMGTEIDFIPFGNNPEDEVTGIAFTTEQYKRIKEALYNKKIWLSKTDLECLNEGE